MQPYAAEAGEIVLYIVAAFIAAIIIVPVALLLLFVLWPLLAGFYFGQPMLGVLAEVIWLLALR